MNILIINSLGILAGTLTTFSQLPQIIKIFKTKSTGDISYGTYFMLIIGTALWTIYGIIINSIPVILANIIAFIFVTAITILKTRYKK